MASLTNNRRPGRTVYSPRALVYGLDEQLLASGFDHYLETPDDAVMSRHVPAHLRNNTYRKVASNAGLDLDCSQRWKEAINSPSRPIEANYYLPGEQVFVLETRSTGKTK